MTNLSSVDFLLMAITLQCIALTAAVAYLFATRTSKPKPKPRLPRAKVAPVQMFPATSATKDLTE